MQDVEILREVCAALCNLSIGDENKFEVCKSGAVPALIILMLSEDMAIASQCAAYLTNLAGTQHYTFIHHTSGCVTHKQIKSHHITFIPYNAQFEQTMPLGGTSV